MNQDNGDDQMGEPIGTVTDVVCGMEVEPENNPYKSEYKTRVYYFCSDKCKKQFEIDPQMYKDDDI